MRSRTQLKLKCAGALCACKSKCARKGHLPCFPPEGPTPRSLALPPFCTALTLTLAVGCVTHKGKASTKLLHIFIHLTPAEFHLLGQLCLGGAAGCSGCDHKRKHHCAISDTTLLIPAIVQQPHCNLAECISKLLHRIKWWLLVMGKAIEHFIREVTKRHPLILTTISAWRTSCVFPPVIQNR